MYSRYHQATAQQRFEPIPTSENLSDLTGASMLPSSARNNHSPSQHRFELVPTTDNPSNWSPASSRKSDGIGNDHARKAHTAVSGEGLRRAIPGIVLSALSLCVIIYAVLAQRQDGQPAELRESRYLLQVAKAARLPREPKNLSRGNQLICYRAQRCSVYCSPPSLALFSNRWPLRYWNVERL